MRKHLFILLTISLVLGSANVVLAAQGRGNGGGGGKPPKEEPPPPEFDPLLHVILVPELSNDPSGPGTGKSVQGVVAISADGSESVSLERLGKRALLGTFDWSPPNEDPDDLDPVQGDWIVWDQGVDKGSESTLHVKDVNGADELEVLIVAKVRSIAWRPTGDWIALTRNRPGQAQGDFEFIRVDGLGTVAPSLQPGYNVATLERDYALSWSPNGEQIAAEVGDLRTVYIYDFDNGTLEATPLDVETLYSPGTFPTNLYEPSWAKQHANWMIVNAQNDPGSHEIWFLDPTGQCPATALLAAPSVNYRPSDWSSDDTQIVFNIGNSGDGLWVGELIIEGGCVTGVVEDTITRIGDWGSWPPKWRR